MSKFRKPSVSYSDVRRGAGTKKERALRASVVARQGDADAPEKDDARAEPEETTATAPALTIVRNDDATPDPAETAVPASDALAIDSDGQEEATSPEAGFEPTPDDATSVAPDAREAGDEEIRSEPKPRPRRKAVSREPEEPNRPSTRTATEAGTVYMQGYVYCPLPGRFDVFDKLVETYGRRKGMAAAISLGLKTLEERIATGKPVDPILVYSTMKGRIIDRRHVDATIAAWAKENLDPLDILSSYALGGQLAKTGLGLYLAQG